MTTSTRILIVDDHAPVRDGIRAFLEHKTPFEVCGEAGDGLTAIARASELKPDLIVMDLAMPLLNGVEAASIVKSAMPDVKIVAVSMYAAELETASASRHFDAILPKSSGLTLLAETIRRLLTHKNM